MALDTKVIIVNTGSWYNQFQGIDNSSWAFTDTLFLLRPIFEDYIKNGTVVVWLPLPPLLDLSRDGSSDLFEWKSFEERNQQAKNDFIKLGVVYLDGVEIANRYRKENDSSISPDGLHWCNPGPTSIPSFINQAVFHAVAVELHRRQQIGHLDRTGNTGSTGSTSSSSSRQRAHQYTTLSR